MIDEKRWSVVITCRGGNIRIFFVHRVGVTRQSMIKIWLAKRLGELAENKTN